VNGMAFRFSGISIKVSVIVSFVVKNQKLRRKTEETMRQSIQIPNNVTPTIFNLPCIFSVHKQADGTPCYLLYDWDEQGQYVEAHPGQWLTCGDDGRWRVTDDKDNIHA
jgi:hypothetical protein